MIAAVGSQSAAEEAASDLEAVTARTLGESYTIDDSLLQYSSGLLLRQDVVDETTLEEDLSQQIGLVTQAYSLYVDGELVGATPYEGALEELLSQLQSSTAERTPSPANLRRMWRSSRSTCPRKGDEPGVSGGAAVQHEDR